MIRLVELTKRYRQLTAVDGMNLAVARGELFGFLGQNGAGKTTTLRMIAGILRPTSGTVEVGGVNIQRQPLEAKRRLGYIPDRPFVYDKLTGAEFLRFAAALYDRDGAAVEHRIDELLDLFELTAWRDELTESYSHGMRQKLIIAGAFVHRPDVIVVDEPMVGLDPRGARILKDLFRRFVDRGGTVLMSTHTLEVAEALCDRIAIVHRGRIAAQGTMTELRAQTASEGMSLEQLFLKLTGAPEEHRVDAVLEA
jgi:ABC-2 type transport system ATP-binding protein